MFPKTHWHMLDSSYLVCALAIFAAFRRISIKTPPVVGHLLLSFGLGRRHIYKLVDIPLFMPAYSILQLLE